MKMSIVAGQRRLALLWGAARFWPCLSWWLRPTGKFGAHLRRKRLAGSR